MVSDNNQTNMDDTARSVFFITLGCAKNEVDTASMKRRVLAAGYALTEDAEEADAVVVNTCSFIQAATEESIDTILEVCSLPSVECGDSKLIVAGCMPARYGDDLEPEFPEAQAFVACSREDDIAQILDGLFEGSSHGVESEGFDSSYGCCKSSDEGLQLEMPAAYVKISDGCDRFCSFCMIPYIRGRYHSFEFEDICREVASRIDEGAREITLIAQDTGRWGEDLVPPQTTASLISRLAERFPDTWFRIMYLEPEGVTDELLEVIASHANVCNYLDIPLQHCSGRIIKAMNRKGDAAQFQDMVDRIRRRIPDITLRTTLIAGFPGETDEDVESLEDFLDAVQFDYVGVFAFSPEDGTRAALLSDQVDEDTRNERAQRLRDFCDSVSFSRVAEREGQEMDVLVLGREEDGQLFGRAQCQAPEVDGVVYLESGEPGEIVRVRISDTLAYEMEGEIVG